MDGMRGGGEPSEFWRRLLRVSVPGRERNAVEGELREGFQERATRQGPTRARRWYRRQVAGFVLRAPWAYRRDGGDRGEGAAMGGWERMGLDLKWAWRGLRRRPGATVLMVATLALGIGANGAIFTLVNAHFLAPLPYDDAGSLISIWESESDGTGSTTVSPGSYYSWRERASSLTGVAAFNVTYLTIGGAGDEPAERVTASIVAPHFFDVLGVDPLLGQRFDWETARATDSKLAVLSEGLWRRRFEADPGLVGRDIRIDGEPHRVVGVLPAGYTQPERSLTFQATELWVPHLLEGQAQNYGSQYLRVVARLAPDADLERARSELEGIGNQLREEYPEELEQRRAVLVPLQEDLLGRARGGLRILLLAGFAVLAAVCANVANLTLARGRERTQEFAVRSALGSGRAALVRQILAESLLLSLGGAIAGLALIAASQRAILAVQMRFLSAIVPASLDLRVVGLTVLAALAAALLFGLPLTRLAATTQLRGALGRDGGGRGRRDRVGATRRALIVGQVGIATALVVVAVLLTRSFTRLVTVPSGFEAQNVVLFSVTAPRAGYPESADVENYFRDLLRVLAEIPGQLEAGMASDLPFTRENRWRDIGVVGWEGEAPGHEFRAVTPGYFGALGIPVEQGVLPDDFWEPGSEVAVVVNRSFANRYWPGASAVGRALVLPQPDTTFPGRVVAVVGDVRDDGFASDPEPMYYLPWGFNPNRRMYVAARFQDLESVTLAQVRSEVSALDPAIPLADLRSLESVVGETVARPRAASLVGAVLALVALLIAATGIYGVISYTVQSRTREIGIRSALGASGRNLESMILRESARPVVAGLAVGLMGAGLAGILLSGLLFQVPAWDPVSLVGAALLLGATAFLSAWVPSRRVVRIQPREALRGE